MRVLQVLEATLAGTRRYLEDVAQALDGNECALAYSLHRADAGFPVLLEKLRASGWQLYELSMRREIDVKSDFVNARKLRAIYRRFQPDVVHAHASKAGALARLATLGLVRRPAVVYSPHAINAARSTVAYVLEKILSIRLDVLAAVTSSERAELRALRLVAPQHVHVVRPAISGVVADDAERAVARSRLAIVGAPIVVAMGRLVEQKQPLQFVEVLCRLREAVPAVRAFWVGDGELRPAMERLIRERGLESSLTITGWITDPRRYLAACDVLVSVAAFESFGYATAEAIALGRPVVASNVVGTIDVVLHDRDMQLFAPGNAHEAAERIAHLIAHPNLAAAVAQRGRESLLHAYTIEETRRTLHDAYAAARGIANIAQSRGTPRPSSDGHL